MAGAETDGAGASHVWGERPCPLDMGYRPLYLRRRWGVNV